MWWEPEMALLLLAALVASSVYTAPAPAYVTPFDKPFHGVSHGGY